MKMDKRNINISDIQHPHSLSEFVKGFSEKGRLTISSRVNWNTYVLKFGANWKTDHKLARENW